MLEIGFAYVAYICEPNKKYIDEFILSEEKIKNLDFNIWSIKGYVTNLQIKYRERLDDHFCSSTCAIDYNFDYFKRISLELDLDEEFKKQQVTKKGNI